jgi:glycine betaine/proline transport system substrate-binding protein
VSRRGAGRRVRVAAAAVAVAFALSGCGGRAPELVPPPGVTPRACGTVTFAANPWAGYEANLAVVSYLARTQLKCEVIVRREPEQESWKNLAAGRVDVILENWGHDDLKKVYIDERKIAVEAGLTGNKGTIGWYVPPWLAEEHPDIVDYRNLNTYAELLRSKRSGEKGQLLAGDPAYVTNDAALVRNLRLNYAVVYAGSEKALIKAFRDAERDRKPLLGYFYAPQWLLSDVPLVKVNLPPWTPGCDADREAVACDYQPYDLDKIAGRRFMYSGSPAAELVKNFQWTNADQNQVARDIADRNLSPDAAAKRWLDANPEKWRAWLPSSRSS